MRFPPRKDVDYDLAGETEIKVSAWGYDNEPPDDVDYTPVEDFVLKAGIPVDEMINFCKASRWDDDIPRLEALKKTLSQSREAPQEAA
jgi:hypothetical protein